MLNACNPECSGTVGVKLLKVSPPVAPTFGGVAGADNICRANFGTSYKAVIADGSYRVANGAGTTLIYPLFQTDWVLKKYTMYRNDGNKDVFLTDAGALLGIRNGVHVDLLNSIYGYSAGDLLDAWSGTGRDWDTALQNCSLFTTTDPGSTSGWIALYVTGASEFPTNNAFYRCDYQAHILCAQQ